MNNADITKPIQKGSPELELQANHGEKTSTEIISQTERIIPFAFEKPIGPIGLDSFLGTISDFKLYLSAQRELLKAGEIAP